MANRMAEQDSEKELLDAFATFDQVRAFAAASVRDWKGRRTETASSRQKS